MGYPNSVLQTGSSRSLRCGLPRRSSHPVYFIMRSYRHCRVSYKAILPPSLVAAVLLFGLAGCRVAPVTSPPTRAEQPMPAFRPHTDALSVQQSADYPHAVRLYARHDYRGALAALDRLEAAPERTGADRAFIQRQREICLAAQRGGVQTFRENPLLAGGSNHALAASPRKRGENPLLAGGSNHALAASPRKRGESGIQAESYPFGISAIVHTRNEARHIVECLKCLQGWTDEILVCDMESTDETVPLARQVTDQIIHHPLLDNFDRARNVSAMRARYAWVLYLDADERVPTGMGPALRDLLAREGHNFEAVSLPFKHYFAGRWLSCLHPGYKAPSLYKNGRFFYNARPHMGAQVDGRTIFLSGEDPNAALVHYSYDSLAHYLDKMNRYTDTEAANLHRDGRAFDWRELVRQMVADWRMYYDGAGAHRDGPHGFLYALNSGFYRAEQHGKLFEHRFRAGVLQPGETQVPGSLEEILEYALTVAREGREPAVQSRTDPLTAPLKGTSGGPESARRQGCPASASRPPDGKAGVLERSSVAATDDGAATNACVRTPGDAVAPQPPVSYRRDQAAEVLWSGPVHSASGYGEESRNFVFALEEAGVVVAAHARPWGRDKEALEPGEGERLAMLLERPVAPGFVQIVQDFAPHFERHPEAGVVIGRTMFETDRLPAEWVRACNRMDCVWVPSEFNQRTVAQASVAEGKLVVVAGCFDAAISGDCLPQIGGRGAKARQTHEQEEET